MLGWLGYERDETVGRKRFSDLLTVGARIYYETHFAPLLLMQGEISGIALDLQAMTQAKQNPLAIIPVAILSPRLSWLWALPLTGWVFANPNHPAATWKIVAAHIVLGVVVVVALRASRRPAGSSAPVVHERASMAGARPAR